MERRRKAWIPGLLAFSLVGFVLGPLAGLGLFPFLVGVVFAYGFEISRPVFADPEREQNVGRGVHGLLWGFVPGAFCMILITMLQWRIPLSGGGTMAAELVVLPLMYGATAAGVAFSTYFVIRKRGPTRTFGRLRVARWLGPASIAWFIGFSFLERTFGDPFSTDVYLAVGILGLLPFIAFAAWALGSAIRWIMNPVPRAAQSEAPRPAVAPTFTPFRGA